MCLGREQVNGQPINDKRDSTKGRLWKAESSRSTGGTKR